MVSPCTVGLTGGLASGKSTVAAMLAERGAAVIDADAVVHSLYEAGGEGAQVVAELIGRSMLDPTGAVDRQLLSEHVLGRPGALARLNAVVHPLVRERIDDWLEELASRPVVPRLAVIEAALLVETGAWRRYDLLAVVWCRREQQVERAVVRGTPEARALALLGAQRSLEEKTALAHVTVDNSRRRDRLEVEVDRVWQELVDLCARREAPPIARGDRC